MERKTIGSVLERICKPENAIWWLGAVAGLALVFLTPPFQVPDEFCHFYRTYHVATGHVKAQVMDRRVGDFLPRGLVTTAADIGLGKLPFHAERKMTASGFKAAFAVSFNPNDRVFADFPNTALLSPVPYLPQAVGIACARIFRPPPIILMYAGRLFNLAVWLLMVAAAVRTVPIGKWLFIVIALMPMSIFQASSLSPDGFTNGAALLLTALAMRDGLEASRVPGWRAVALFTALAVALTLSKFAYGLFSLLFFLPALRRLASSDRRRLFLQGMVVVGLAGLAWLGWALTARGLFLNYSQYNPLYRDGLALMKGAQPDLQMGIVLKAPLVFLDRVLASLIDQRIWEPFIARLGWWDVVFPLWFIYGYWVWLLATALTDGTWERVITWPQKILASILAGSSVVFFCLLSYLQWSPVDYPSVIYLQGRYFIPIGPLALLVLTNRRFSLQNWKMRDRVNALGLILSLALTVFYVARRYYWL